MPHIQTNLNMPEEDMRWLKAEAKRRRCLEMDVINALMDLRMPDGFVTQRRMTEDEFAKHLAGIVLQLVREARLADAARSN